MPENKHLKFLLIVVYIVIGYFFITKILPKAFIVFLPFILAAIVALITRPLVKLLKKIKIPNLLSSLISLMMVLAIIMGIIIAIINRLLVEIGMLRNQMPAIIASLPDTITRITDRWNSFSEALSPDMSSYINDALQNISSSLISLATPATQKLFNFATTVASSLPYILIFTVAFLFSCIFFTKDFEYLKNNIAQQFPKSVMARMVLVKGYAFTALGKYIKGVLIILFITFVELLTGFLILDIPYAFILALIIALLDALPAVGTGAILIPWAIIDIFSGNIKMGISLLAIYLIILVVRQFIEPKIMSSTFGTYPIVTLVGMYAGLRLFGFVGMVLMPIILTIIIYMQRAGLFTIWKTKNTGS